MIGLLCSMLCIVLASGGIVDENEPGLHRPSRIAIIGAGIGGTSAAFEIKEKADHLQIEVDIDIFEKESVGGRLATVEVNGRKFEVGGSIIHNQNQYMNYYCKKFGMKKRINDDSNFLFGLFDGDKFVLEESHYKALNAIKFFWRYGWHLYFLGDITDSMLEKFSKIYENQVKNGEPYDNVKDLLKSMDPSFPELLNVSLHQDLARQGYNGLIVEEFIFLATNINYNQNLSMHAFVGAVAMAGGAESSLLFSIEGGNERVPEELLKHSGARLVNAKVNSVSLSPNGSYGVELEGSLYTRTYDIVILAAPLVDNSPQNVKFENFPSPITSSVFQYQRTVTTIVHGDLNYDFFGCDKTKFTPRHIFATNEKVFFNSISLLTPVAPDPSYDFKVYKVFSKEPLTKSQLDLLFVEYDIVKVIDWLAYPHYDTLDRNPSFVLYKNLFHVNAVEWAASAMEMSVIGAHNVMLQVIRALTSHE